MLSRSLSRIAPSERVCEEEEGLETFECLRTNSCVFRFFLSLPLSSFFVLRRCEEGRREALSLWSLFSLFALFLDRSPHRLSAALCSAMSSVHSAGLTTVREDSTRGTKESKCLFSQASNRWRRSAVFSFLRPRPPLLLPSPRPRSLSLSLLPHEHPNSKNKQ